jgi:DNA-binding response OmpR family regulator
VGEAVRIDRVEGKAGRRYEDGAPFLFKLYYKRVAMEVRILIVDDSTETLAFLQSFLTDQYEVLTAENGVDALTKLKEEQVGVVISDILMPGMDGLQLCRMIKSDVNLSHIPVILLTAKRELESKVEGLELGADAYMEKPFSDRLLLAQISSLLSNRRNVREFFIHSPLAHIGSIAYSKADEKFLTELNGAIHENMENPGLGIDLLARSLNMSRATLYRKIRGISDVTPLELINIVRLKKAALLLLETDHKVNEVARLTGFNSKSSFSRNFYKQFKQMPSDFARDKSGARKEGKSDT